MMPTTATAAPPPMIQGILVQAWGDWEVSLLIRQHRMGISPQEIADTLNRPLSSIRGKLHQLRVKGVYVPASPHGDRAKKGAIYRLQERSGSGWRPVPGKYLLVAVQPGPGKIVHHVFRNLGGGWLTSLTNRQIGVDWALEKVR